LEFKGIMKYYTNTGTRRTIDRCNELDVGLLIVSPYWVNPDRWPYYAIDNGAYANWRAKKEFDEKAFYRIVCKAEQYLRETQRYPEFIVLPDIVAGGTESLAFSKEWYRELTGGIQYFSMRYYLAVQDGMTEEDVWRALRAMPKVCGIFVGGTMKWKLETSEQWSKFAKHLGIGCHIGRIGPTNRIVWAKRIGASSIDSTTWVQRNGSIEYVARAKNQTTLEVN